MDLKQGGAEKFAISHTNLVNKSKKNILIVVKKIPKNSIYKKIILENDIKLIELNFLSLKDPRIQFSLFKVLNNIKTYKVINTHLYSLSLCYLSILLLQNCKWVHFVHFNTSGAPDGDSINIIHKKMNELIVNYKNIKIICLSESSYRNILKYYKYKNNLIFKLNLFFINNLILKKNPTLFQQLKLIKKNNQKTKIVVLVGSINKHKNQKFLFDSLNKIKLVDTIYILLFGDISDQKYFNLLRLDDYKNIKYMGFTSDMKTVFQLSDVFIHLSNNESGPLVFIEALNYGKPMVISNFSGYSEYFKNQKGIEVLDEITFSNLEKSLNKTILFKKKDLINIKDKFKMLIKNKFSKKKFLDKYLKIVNS